MLTNASKYAIRAVLFIAKNANKDNKISAIQIAEGLDIPTHFIAKLLQPLAKNNIISSLKGPKGGFYFTIENGKKSVCDIIHITEGKDVFIKCFMGLPRCGNDNPCPVHHIVARFKEKILKDFNKNISDFSNDIDLQGSFLSLKDD